MYCIYANIWGILMGSMLPYIAAPWIRHGIGIIISILWGCFPGHVDDPPNLQGDGLCQETSDFMSKTYKNIGMIYCI